ncbi:MAG: hypothetical protein IT373_04010 [Polyangiaceae bacterium]|nr:hypothetical protein [Polyangiaceae bacterium]
MLRLLKRLVIALVLLVFAGCAGGGCSSGCACGGLEPLPGGFDASKRIENAAAVRLTQSGLQFLQDNVGTLAATLIGGGGGIMTFEVPETSGSQLGIDYAVCQGGADPNANPPKCVAEIDIGNAQLAITSENPHDIRIQGPLPIRLQSLPINIVYFCVPLLGCVESNIVGVLNGNGACPNNAQTFANIPLNVDISIEIDADPNHSRFGYSKVKVNTVDIDQNTLEGSLHFCGGFDASILNALKGIILPMLIDPLIGTLTDQIDAQLCQQANPAVTPPCPTGTVDVNGVCRYGNDANAECASIMLGLDGHVNAGALLSSFSPGTRGAFDFLLASGGHNLRDDGSGFHWGDLNPIASGATLGFYGGSEARPMSNCVPISSLPMPTAIPIPDELLANTVPDWPQGDPNVPPAPHVGLALSERFTNYLMAQVYNSGTLCLGITGDLVPQLTSSLVAIGIGAPSMNELGWQKQAQQLAIAIRPQQPPEVHFGNGTDLATDPLIRVTAKQMVFDFYIWSLDRFVRAFSASLDLDVPVNLVVTPDGLQPVIDQIGVSNGVVTTSLLREDPTKIAASLQDLLGSMVGQFIGGAIPPVDLNGSLASLGLTLVIPDTVDGQGSPGLRKLSKGSDSFLGIFAALGVVQAKTSVDTTVGFVSFDAGDLGWSGAERRLPEAVLDLGTDLASAGQRVEWQYRVDNLPWHPFRSDRRLVARDPWLSTEGKHVVSVRARVVGDPLTLDREPATFQLDVDSSPPFVAVQQAEGTVLVTADDAVSGDATMVRVRLGRTGRDGAVRWHPWSDWTAAAALEAFDPGDNDRIEVEAEDETGHVGSTSQALLRGRVGDSGGGGCGCVLAGSGERGGSAWWLAALGVGAVLGRRVLGRRGRAHRAGVARRWRELTLALVVLTVPGMFAGCNCAEDETTAETGCRATGTCVALNPGLIGAYTSATVDAAGTVWIAGYLEADWAGGFTWGDLVVGSYTGGDVVWTLVDGVPTEPPVNANLYDPQGFRGGQTEPGDDVGLWTSIALDANGQPALAYYDATHHALRYASFAGGGWASTEVVGGDKAENGRYAKLSFVSGLPVIAYQFVEAGDAGAVRSGVRLALGSAVGASQATWTFEEVAADEATPCRARYCATGTTCVKSTGTCLDKSKDCPASCASGESCVLVNAVPQCEAVYGNTQTDSYPDATGLYVSLAANPVGGLGVAFYDRIHGNVVVASKAGAAWTTVIADGESAGTDTGDKGIGLSLAIDLDGNYHLSYVDGLEEAVNYVKVTAGTTPGTPEVVDTGAGNSDGQHLVGDDSNILVTQGGEIRVSYQDASEGTLRLAVGTPSQGAHAWTVTTLPQDGHFAGAFSRQVELPGGSRIVNWWRVATPSAIGNVSVVAP